LLIEDGRVEAIENWGAFDALTEAQRIGNRDWLVVPGLVNAHQHGQPDAKPALGVEDAPLECWLVALLAAPAGDPYADTLRLCRQLARAGVTTAIHSHYRTGSTPEAYDAELRILCAGYRDGGVRGVIACDVRDRGQPVYGDTGAFLAGLPSGLRERVDSLLNAPPPVPAMLEVIAGLRADASAGRLGDVAVIYGPPGPPWCSDELLSAVAEAAESERAPVHTHLVETWYEAELGRREHGDGAVPALQRLGLLNERLFVAHGVWLDASDREAFARAGASVVTNPASNLRLHAGVAPVRELIEAGVNVAIGTDNMALNEHDDLLGELRLMRALQRRSGIAEAGLDARTCLDIATRNGGRAIGRPDIGELRVGAVGDLVAIDLTRLRRTSDAGALEVVVACATPADVAAVVAGGRVLDRSPLAAPCRDADPELREIAEALSPHVRSHLGDWRA
jgi:cytosine/adenosine deaminase-related metal-dependent hydrolase